MARAVLGGRNDYREPDGEKSMSAKINRQTRNFTRKLLVEDPGDYSKVNQLILECFPPFTTPGRFPLFGSFMFVESLDIEPFSAMDRDESNQPVLHQGFPTHDVWMASIQYGPLPYQPQEDNTQQPLLQNLERTWSIGAEAMSLPGSRLYWEGDLKPTGDESIASFIRIETIIHTFTKHHVNPAGGIPWEAIRTCNNRVNTEDFANNHPLFPGVKAETLLFQGVQISNRMPGNGTIENSVSYTFSERSAKEGETQLTWNHLYDATDGQRKFRKIFKDSANERPLYDLVANTTIVSMFQ